jgi:hypothetical protein
VVVQLLLVLRNKEKILALAVFRLLVAVLVVVQVKQVVEAEVLEEDLVLIQVHHQEPHQHPKL